VNMILLSQFLQFKGLALNIHIHVYVHLDLWENMCAACIGWLHFFKKGLCFKFDIC
jgi:hypothetical protein